VTARLIGLTGMKGRQAGVGKDEAAKALIGRGWKRDAFADRMRKAMLALDPVIDYDGIFGELRLSRLVERDGWDGAKRNHPEVRRLLQKFGTEAGRDIHGTSCWVDALFRDWTGLSPLVITDVRFDNEAQAVRDRGGRVVRIVRPGLEPLPGEHASEIGVTDDLVDEVVMNDRTVADLHSRILRVAEERP
jgi:hypothetical protein